MKRSFWMGLTLWAFSTLPTFAHEFWLMPDDFTLAPGDQMQVAMRVGQNLSGIAMIYNAANFTRFEVVSGDTSVPVPGRMGDLPALAMQVGTAGLTIVVHETTDLTLNYTDFTKFQSFVTHKALTGVAEAHTARGLPETGFIESYRRYAKSLIAVGDGAGADRAMGLRIEIVALANPYTDDVSAGLPLQVLLNGAPRAGAQVELFAMAPDGTVTTSLHTTDATGRVTVPTASGHIYLADNVDMVALPNNDPTAGPVWHSDWASLTYQMP